MECGENLHMAQGKHLKLEKSVYIVSNIPS